VINSKLTDEERAGLDKDLAIEELDSALEKANLKSVPCIGLFV
jgi:hypothetical protein